MDPPIPGNAIHGLCRGSPAPCKRSGVKYNGISALREDNRATLANNRRK